MLLVTSVLNNAGGIFLFTLFGLFPGGPLAYPAAVARRLYRGASSALATCCSPACCALPGPPLTRPSGEEDEDEEDEDEDDGVVGGRGVSAAFDPAHSEGEDEEGRAGEEQVMLAALSPAWQRTRAKLQACRTLTAHRRGTPTAASPAAIAAASAAGASGNATGGGALASIRSGTRLRKRQAAARQTRGGSAAGGTGGDAEAQHLSPAHSQGLAREAVSGLEISLAPMGGARRSASTSTLSATSEEASGWWVQRGVSGEPAALPRRSSVASSNSTPGCRPPREAGAAPAGAPAVSSPTSMV